ncbi:MAG: hypothetical protein ACRCXC_02365 [Legionella sp.]
MGLRNVGVKNIGTPNGVATTGPAKAYTINTGVAYTGAKTATYTNSTALIANKVGVMRFGGLTRFRLK